MPLLELDKILVGKIALWCITEDERFLANQANVEKCPDEIISKQKRLEWLSGRLLIRHIVETSGLSYKGIRKDEFGKPYLNDIDQHISLSHSYPYVAAQLHPHHSVGIDIEQPKDKLLKIAPRILDQTELKNAGENIVKHCVYWCAKEALYKVYGRRGLLFTNHLHVKPFELKERGDLEGWITIGSDKLFNQLHYIVTEDYVLVYSKTN